MTGADAAMLYTETASSHMHTLTVAVLDPSVGRGTYDRARLVEELRTRLHLLPHLRSRAVPVPLGIHHPVWVEDPAFDLERHVGEVDLPSPGDDVHFDAALSTIRSRPLPRDRPLWAMTLVAGQPADPEVEVGVRGIDARRVEIEDGGSVLGRQESSDHCAAHVAQSDEADGRAGDAHAGIHSSRVSSMRSRASSKPK